jgi:hypothetical protein
MLEAVLGHLYNWFEHGHKVGTFTISGGVLAFDIPEGQYYRIKGSVFNDGLHQSPETLIDEEFTGEIFTLAIPQEVISLSEEIKAYCEANPVGAYTSESFGGYSYSKATNPNGTVAQWQDVFRSRLNRWRKLP